MCTWGEGGLTGCCYTRQLADSVVIGVGDASSGNVNVVLFVKLKPGQVRHCLPCDAVARSHAANLCGGRLQALTDGLTGRIKQRLRTEVSPRYG